MYGSGHAISTRVDINKLYDVPKSYMPEIVVTEEEVKKCIDDINIYKASSVPNISSRILKDAFAVIIPQLTHMYNCSFKKNIFPCKWKIAKVIPLQKPGNKCDVNNLRPVSLLPLPGKIAERLAHTKLICYLETNNYINENQGGFRKGRSTVITETELTDDIGMGLNNNEYTIACFIDLRKAFDTVNHKILLNKLQNFGLHKNTISWLENYLSQRYQTCFANNVNSTPRLLKCGVPKGSILGPLLFLLYINDIDYNLSNTNVKLYADDTVIYSTKKEEAIAYENVERDLKNLMNWCGNNQLTVNIKKTKLVLFGTKEMLRNSRHIDMYMGTEKL